MLTKKLATLLSLLVLLAIGQSTFLIDAASAGHNCWRPPYHCLAAFGTYETIPSVASTSRAGSPSAILVESSQPTDSGNPVSKVYVYTNDPNNKLEVELAEDAKEYYEHLKTTHGITKAQGLMVLSKDEGEKWRLVEFYPSDMEDPKTSKPRHPDGLPDCRKPFQQYLYPFK